MAFVQDITKRKQDEAELRRLQNYLSNIIDSMPSILVAVDHQGRVTLWNHQTEKVTGLSFEKARRQPLAMVFPRLDNEMQRVSVAIRESRAISTTKVRRRSDYGSHFEDITIFPAGDQRGGGRGDPGRRRDPAGAPGRDDDSE